MNIGLGEQVELLDMEMKKLESMLTSIDGADKQRVEAILQSIQLKLYNLTNIVSNINGILGHNYRDRK